MEPLKVINHGNPRWRVDFGRVEGKRRVRFFATKRAATASIEAFQDEQKYAGGAWLSLPSKDRVRILEILSEMQTTGISLWDLWDGYKAGRVALSNRTSPDLKTAVKAVLASKIEANRRPRYVDSLKSYLEKFIDGRETQSIGEITSLTIQQWFTARGEKPSTRKSNAGRLSAMFTFAVRQGWIDRNPCDRLEPVTVETKRPVVLTVAKARDATKWVAKNLPEFLPFWVLGLFAGIRPEELRALTWSQVDLKGHRVLLIKTKDRRARVVPLEKNAVAWLETVKVRKRRGAIGPSASTLKRWRARVAAGAEFVWHQDILRKTCATYWLARYPDAGKVSMWLGNSPVILLRHYRAVATASEARAFLAIQPAVLGGVIKLNERQAVR